VRLYKHRDVWHCAFYDLDGRRLKRSTHCRDRKAAEAVARQWERRAADPDHAAAQAATMTDAVRLLLNDRTEQATAGRRGTATVAFYRLKAGHLLRVFGDAKLATLRARDVDAYVSQRRREGAGEHTVSKELVTLRAALKLARRAGLWAGDPAAVCPVAFAPEYKPRSRWLTRAEVHALLSELLPDRSARAAFIVATSACWHETELARREDLAPDLSTVLIRGTKRSTRYRTVPMVLPAARELLAYACEHAEGTDGLLFRPWGNVRRDLLEACTRAGIAPCSPNDLRRTCATWLRAGGAPPDLIAPVLGHADTRMVERVYGRLSPADLAARLGAALGLPTETHGRQSGADSADSPDSAQRSAREILRNLCPGTESNRPHEDFQSSALPTELPGLTWGKHVP
jgi:integrase